MCALQSAHFPPNYAPISLLRRTSFLGAIRTKRKQPLHIFLPAGGCGGTFRSGRTRSLVSRSAEFTVANAPRPPPLPLSQRRPQLFSRVMTPPGRYKISAVVRLTGCNRMLPALLRILLYRSVIFYQLNNLIKYLPKLHGIRYVMQPY